MRFFDILSQWGRIPPEAREAILFDASEIASELDKVQRSRGGSYPRETFGVCAPPFRDRYFWIEAITRFNPESSQSPGDSAEFEGLGFTSEEILRMSREYQGFQMARGVLCIARDYRDSDSGRRYREAGEDYDSGRWLIEVTGHIAVYKPGEISLKSLITPRALAFVVIGRDGALLSNPDGILVESPEADPRLRELSAHGLTNMLPFALLSLSFLHRRTEVDYITPNRLERKRAAREFGQKSGAVPLRDYYLLRVRPHVERDTPITDPAQIRPLGSPRSGDKRAHSVRGHFRRVPESGLFGRGYNAGELIWIPDHLRGERSLGDVAKGYKITGSK